jgi:hypothetical protein
MVVRLTQSRSHRGHGRRCLAPARPRRQGTVNTAPAATRAKPNSSVSGTEKRAPVSLRTGRHCWSTSMKPGAQSTMSVGVLVAQNAGQLSVAVAATGGLVEQNAGQLSVAVASVGDDDDDDDDDAELDGAAVVEGGSLTGRPDDPVDGAVPAVALGPANSATLNATMSSPPAAAIRRRPRRPSLEICTASPHDVEPVRPATAPMQCPNNALSNSNEEEITDPTQRRAKFGRLTLAGSCPRLPRGIHARCRCRPTATRAA